MNQERKRRILQFVEDKGFYIILALCVTAIGISGYVLFFAEGEPEELPVVLADPEPQVPVVRPDPEDTEVPAVRPELPELPEPDQTVMNPAKPARVKPVEGKVLRPFSGEDLVYDRTMGDWRTHNGIDYAAAQGTPVAAVCDAVIGAAWTDGLRGNCLRLDCGDQTFVTYCGLDWSEEAVPGAQVKAGQQIGTLGGSMLTESCEESHLHLEVVKNGRYQDPEKFLK